MIGVGILHPGKEVEAVVKTDFVSGFTAVTNIVFAFCMQHRSSIHRPTR
jgi:hypothetical protein